MDPHIFSLIYVAKWSSRNGAPICTPTHMHFYMPSAPSCVPAGAASGFKGKWMLKAMSSSPFLPLREQSREVLQEVIISLRFS